MAGLLGWGGFGGWQDEKGHPSHEKQCGHEVARHFCKIVIKKWNLRVDVLQAWELVAAGEYLRRRPRGAGWWELWGSGWSLYTTNGRIGREVSRPPALCWRHPDLMPLAICTFLLLKEPAHQHVDHCWLKKVVREELGCITISSPDDVLLFA